MGGLLRYVFPSFLLRRGCLGWAGLSGREIGTRGGEALSGLLQLGRMKEETRLDALVQREFGDSLK
jgi:hypothetical protein